jgi:hypothetical protein
MCFAAYELAKKRSIRLFFLELYYYISTVYMYNTYSKNTVHDKTNSIINFLWIITESCATLKGISFSIRRFQHLCWVGPLPGLWHSGGGGADTPTLHQTSPSNQAGFIRRVVPLFVISVLNLFPFHAEESYAGCDWTEIFYSACCPLRVRRHFYQQQLRRRRTLIR